MNLYLSEVVSDIIEPIVGTIEGGEEVVSTEDLLANIEGINSSNMEWSNISWWEGKESNSVVGCGRCTDDVPDNLRSLEKPEKCRCPNQVVNEDGDGVTKTTSSYVRWSRRKMWEESYDWNSEDISKVVRSSEVLPEDLQDFTVPMVIVGGD